MYYCKKCGQKHRYDSKIGIKHLNINKNDTNTGTQQPLMKKNCPLNTCTENNTEREKGVRGSNFIHSYLMSYRKGVERFGIWWKIFQLSIWGFVLIFVLTAIIIFVVFLPKIDTINWILR